MSATEPQLRAIYAIGRGARGLEGEEVDALSRDRFGALPAELTRRQASELIDALKVRRDAD